jgi:uncharacterized membrane protein
MLYLLLKTIHILSAITALGANLSYGLLLFRAHREPQHLLFMLKTIRWIDGKVANRFYILVLITGLWMIWLYDYPFTLLWVWLSLTLFASVALMGILLYAPVLNQQIQLVERNQTNSDEYRKVNRKSNLLGISVTLMVLAILVLMVFKPASF